MARKRSSLVALTATLAALAAPTTASAATTDCDGLQEALDASSAGEVVTLADPNPCHGHYDLPDHPITLAGGAGAATLSGDIGEGRDQILSGFNVGSTTIKDLTFREGRSGGSGGAIEIQGDSPVTIQDNTFLDNDAAEENGGAVSIVTDNNTVAKATRGEALPIVLRDNTFGGDEGNSAANNGGGAYISAFFRRVVVDGNDFLSNDATRGGGLYVDAASSLELTDNGFDQNHADLLGGGAYVDNTCDVEVTDNDFTGNLLDAEDESLAGGGLYATSGQACSDLQAARGGTSAQLTQSGNLFQENALSGTFSNGAGAGEAIATLTVQSTDDRFVDNRIQVSGLGSGGGLAYTGFGSAPFDARNLVAKGNTVVTAAAPGTRGAAAPQTFGGALFLLGRASAFRIEDSTLVENQAARGSAIYAPGLRSDLKALGRGIPSSGTLVLQNSIVFGNTGATDGEIGGLPDDAQDVRSSDTCVDGAPHPGTGNICANPHLIETGDPGTVDQPKGGPTIDRGDSSLVDADLARDYAGDPRVLAARVDMGADEYKPAAPAPPPAAQPPAAAPPAPAQAVLGAQQRSCRSKRAFRIRIRVPHGKKAISAVVRVNGKRVKVVRGKRLRAPVRLRGLPKGKFKVRITLRLANGKRITGVRTYHTCIPKLPGDGPPKV